MLGTWLGRVVGIGIVAGAIAACGNSTSTDNPTGDDGGADAHVGEGDASVYEAGSDASPYNPNLNDAGECISNCHVDAPCTVASTCASGVCTDSKCADPSGMDGMKDGTETASDCGGVCSACADHLGCVVGGDCISGVCDATTKTCAAPTDMDHVQNGTETDVDCGDSGTGEADNAPACGDGLKCNVAADCLDGLCGANKTCTPASCMDNILNGTETAVDCGGLCNPCVDGDTCKVDADCVDKHCDTGNTDKCLAPTNMDGRQNGNETGVDCGSSGKGINTNAPPCSKDTDGCLEPVDCASGVCGANFVCADPTCTDKVKNGLETGVDCGNSAFSTCPACPTGQPCVQTDVPNDCVSLHCDSKTNLCDAPTSTDGIQNGNESDVDCGSSGTGTNTGAPACLDINKTTLKISKCSANADCKSTFCNTTEKECVDGASCALPIVAKASGIQDIKTATKTTSPTADAVGVPNANGAGLYAGIDTCGVGEATDAPGSRHLESCCKSLDSVTTGDRIDKYEVTSGRMRQFVESVNASYPDYNFKAWVAAQFNATTNLPSTPIGTTLYSQIPTPTSTGKATTTDTRALFPSSEHGTLNVVQQLGGISLDTGIPSDLQGCFTGPLNEGSSTYWWDAAGEDVVGSPPRQFTQDYYDIKPLNCAMYWMAAAFCAWDGGYLPDDAHYQALWGTGNYPWGTDTTYPTVPAGTNGVTAYSRTFQDLGTAAGTTGQKQWAALGYPLITTYTVNNFNDNSNTGNFYFYPNNNNPPPIVVNQVMYAGIPDTIDNGTDFSPYIASPGRFVPDTTAYKATTGSVYAGDAWQDVAANLFEYHALPQSSFNSGGIFCDTSDGVLTNPNANSTTSCPTTENGVATEACVRANYQGKYVCGFERGSGTAAAPVSAMPSVRWQGGSWEVHAIPVGGYGFQGSYQMNTQYGKAGFRCARKAE